MFLSFHLQLFLFLQSAVKDPRDWAWGLHPDRGLDYKAKDGLSLEVSLTENYQDTDQACLQVCLDNPELINTAKCSLPLDLCLSNKQFTPLVGCSGHKFPLQVCLSNPVLIPRDNCAGYQELDWQCWQF